MVIDFVSGCQKYVCIAAKECKNKLAKTCDNEIRDECFHEATLVYHINLAINRGMQY